MRFFTFIFTILIIFQCVSEAKAENGYIPGYVITIKGDTITGLLDYREKNISVNKISFKKSDNAQVIKYTPTQIKGYGIDGGERFESHRVKMVKDNLHGMELSDSPKMEFMSDDVFLNVITYGRIDLFRYKDNIRSHFFVRKEKGELMELLYHRYRKNLENGRLEHVSVDKYIGQLRLLMSDCIPLIRKIKNIRFLQIQLTNLVIKYNEYFLTGNKSKSDKNRTYVRKKGKLILEPGAIVGLNFIKQDLSTSKKPSFGVALNIIRERNNRKWSLNNELVYSSISDYREHSKFVHENQYSYTKIHEKFSYLKYNIMGRYQFPRGKFRPFVNYGLAFRFVLDYEGRLESFKKFYKEEEAYSHNLSEPGDNSFEHFIGLGLSYNRWSFETRLANFFSLGSFDMPAVEKMSLQLTYHLGK